MLAARAVMSPRTFARAFRAETGTTPAAHVEELRVEAARRLLETTDLTVSAIARQVGLRHPETLHRAFLRLGGHHPRPLPPALRPPPRLTTHSPTRQPRRRTPCRSPSASTPSSPPWTPSGRTRCSPRSPASRWCCAPPPPDLSPMTTACSTWTSGTRSTTSRRPTSPWYPGGSSPGDWPATGTRSSTGSPAPTRPPRSPRRCAPGRCYWVRRGILDGL